MLPKVQPLSYKRTRVPLRYKRATRRSVKVLSKDLKHVKRLKALSNKSAIKSAQLQKKIVNTKDPTKLKTYQLKQDRLDIAKSRLDKDLSKAKSSIADSTQQVKEAEAIYKQAYEARRLAPDELNLRSKTISQFYKSAGLMGSSAAIGDAWSKSARYQSEADKKLAEALFEDDDVEEHK